MHAYVRVCTIEEYIRGKSLPKYQAVRAVPQLRPLLQQQTDVSAFSAFFMETVQLLKVCFMKKDTYNGSRAHFDQYANSYDL